MMVKLISNSFMISLFSENVPSDNDSKGEKYWTIPKLSINISAYVA